MAPMRKCLTFLLFHSLVVFLTVLGYPNSVEAKVTQQAKVRFPGIGLVQVGAVEAFGELPHLEFSDAVSSKVISSIPVGTSDPDDFKPTPELSATNPFLRFRVLSIRGLPQPLILAVAVAPGGSDTRFEAVVVGAVEGKFAVLTSEPLRTLEQGGVYVGNLGRGRGMGAASWVFIWGEAPHYGAHRYEVKLYPFDAATFRFRRGKTLISRRKYEGRGEGALSELKLPFVDILKGVLKIEEIVR